MSQKNVATENKNIRPQPLILEVFGLVSVSPIYTGLIYVKIPTTNFSCLTPLKGRIRNALPSTLFYALTRREIITVRGQSYVSPSQYFGRRQT